MTDDNRHPDDPCAPLTRRDVIHAALALAFLLALVFALEFATPPPPRDALAPANGPITGAP